MPTLEAYFEFLVLILKYINICSNYSLLQKNQTLVRNYYNRNIFNVIKIMFQIKKAYSIAQNEQLFKKLWEIDGIPQYSENIINVELYIVKIYIILIFL